MESTDPVGQLRIIQKSSPQRVWPVKTLAIQRSEAQIFCTRGTKRDVVTPRFFQATEYSDELMHIAAWIAHEEDAPARITYDSIRPLQRACEDHSSPNPQGIADICQKMVSSHLMLRNEC